MASITVASKRGSHLWLAISGITKIPLDSELGRLRRVYCRENAKTVPISRTQLEIYSDSSITVTWTRWHQAARKYAMISLLATWPTTCLSLVFVTVLFVVTRGMTIYILRWHIRKYAMRHRGQIVVNTIRNSVFFDRYIADVIMHSP